MTCMTLVRCSIEYFSYCIFKLDQKKISPSINKYPSPHRNRARRHKETENRQQVRDCSTAYGLSAGMPRRTSRHPPREPSWLTGGTSSINCDLELLLLLTWARVQRTCECSGRTRYHSRRKGEIASYEFSAACTHRRQQENARMRVAAAASCLGADCFYLEFFAHEIWACSLYRFPAGLSRTITCSTVLSFIQWSIVMSAWSLISNQFFWWLPRVWFCYSAQVFWLLHVQFQRLRRYPSFFYARFRPSIVYYYKN